MSKKSQDELEQTVKGYELQAVEEQVKSLTTQVTTEFARVNGSLETLLVKSQTQVTPQQFAENMSVLKSTLEEKIDEEIKKVHLEYRPLKKTINWLLVTVFGAAIAIFGQVVFILNLTKGG